MWITQLRNTAVRAAEALGYGVTGAGKSWKITVMDYIKKVI
jgi:hypothetical protein